MNDAVAERRRYFRIDDHVRIRYQVVKNLAHLPGHDGGHSGPPDKVLLNELESEFNASLNALWLEDPLTAQALAQLNRKLDLLKAGEKMGGVAVTALASPPTRVNISACGIAFPVSEKLTPGQLLDLNITLLPSEINLRFTARVVIVEEIPEAEQSDGMKFLLRAEFAGPESRLQEILISHIVQRQQAQRSSDDQ